MTTLAPDITEVEAAFKRVGAISVPFSEFSQNVIAVFKNEGEAKTAKKELKGRKFNAGSFATCR